MRNEKLGFFSKIGLGCLLLVGLGLNADLKRLGRKEKDDIKEHSVPLIVVLQEHNPTLEDKFNQAVKGHIGNPIVNNGTKYWKVNGDIDFFSAPKPYYAIGTENFTPIYRIFKGPTAFDKATKWLKDNQYKPNALIESPDWSLDVRKLEFTKDGETFRMGLEDINNGTSYIKLEVYFEAKDKLYYWEGNNVEKVKKEYLKATKDMIQFLNPLAE